MKKNKIIMKIALALLITCTISIVTIFELGRFSKVKANDVVTKPNLIVSATEKNGYVTPGTSGNITFTLKLDKAPTEDVTILFHAEDVTAIAEAGDYVYVPDDFTKLTDDQKIERTHSTSSITIDSSNYNGVTISYNTEKAKYACTGPDKEYLYNYFNFVIDSYEGCEYTGNTNFKCRMNYNILLDMSKYSDTGYYYYKYFTQQCVTEFNFDYKKETYHYETFVCCKDLGDIESIYNNTVAQGWGNLNICLWVNNIQSRIWDKESTNFKVSFGGRNIVFDQIGSVNCGGENYEDNDEEHMDIDRDIYSGVEYYTEKDPWKDGKTHTKTYFKIDKDLGYIYNIAVDNTADYARWGQLKTKQRLSDDVAPVLLNTYANLDTLMIDGKLRLILRFSELVDGHDTTIQGVVGGNKNLIFRYVTGSGTNTLVYETDMKIDEFESKSLEIKKLVLDSFDGKVYDLGYNWKTKSTNTCNINFKQKEIDIYIDLRKPQLSEANTERQEDSKQTRTVSVTVSEVSKGMLYYCWTKDKTGAYDEVQNYKAMISSGSTTNYAGSKSIEKTSNSSQVFSFGSPLGLDGDYYLHILAVSEFGKKTYQVCGVKKSGVLESGYHFDNTAPTFTITSSSDSDQFNKVFDYDLDDNFLYESADPSGISNICLRIYEASNPENVADVILVNEASNVRLYETGGSVSSGRFIITLDKTSLKIKVKSKELVDIPTIGYGTFYYCFYAEDKAGNTTLTNPVVYEFEKFDTRTQFSCKMTADRDNLYSEIDGKTAYGMLENVYDINEIGGETLSITFTNEEIDNVSIDTDIMNVLKIYYGNKDIPVYTKGGSDSYSDYITVSEITNGKKTNLKISPKKAGFYRIELVVNRTLTDSSTLDLYSMEDFEFYVTDHSYDTYSGTYNYENTTNYVNSLKDLTIINKVFQLNNSFAYLSSLEKVETMQYNNCVSPASFSSELYAKEYIKFMEYQDLQLLVIDAQQASLLAGGGSTKYQKADGQDGITPVSGQTWIRYKRYSWNENSSLEGWAYYFYSNRSETTINIGSLSSNCPLLVTALNNVVDNILKKGAWVYLTEEDYFDKFNCPTLKDGQIHKNLETVSSSITGSVYSTLLSYDGDPGMYLNTTTIGGESLTVGSGLIINLSEINKLYYLSESTNELIPVDSISGVTLSKALGDSVGSGTLRFIELDGNGVREFYLVLDKEAPVVNLKWKVTGNNASDIETNVDLNGNNNGDVYSAKSMIISASNKTSEIDSLAFVAVYTAPQYGFVSITYYKDLLQNPIELTNGNYYVVIGDRYGNTYRFTAKVCDTKLEATITVVDGQYVLVKTNRNSDQIERFEVRCNNILSDKVFDEKGNKYQEDGYYNIYIKDIYGYTNSVNGEFGESCLFERSLPNLTWYYLNSNDKYVKYEDGYNTYMSINSSLESNTFYIKTSKTLRFVYDGEYGYSFTGISESNVVHNSNSHYVNINTTENWTMKIWYTAYPNVVATYICTNDTDAPKITCSYKVNSYELEEKETMDALAPLKALNNVYYLDNIKFKKTGTETVNIQNNEWISSNLITVNASDLSGVSSVLVYLDGELYKEYLDLNGTFSGCSLSRSGVYKIVAKDNFGNIRELAFTNKDYTNIVEKVDSVVIKNSESVIYGNTSASITLKDNALIYINAGEYFLFYTLKDGKLIYTKYVNTDIGSNTKSYEFISKTKTIDTEEGKVTVDDAFFDISSKDFKSDTRYEFKANKEGVQLTANFKELDGIKFYVSYTIDGNITIEFECPDNSNLSLETSVLFDDSTVPYYYNVELSKEVTDITLETISKEIINCENNKVVRTNTNFSILNTNLNEIKEIKYSYSKTKEFIEYDVLFENQKFVKDLDTTKNGFYSFIITNKYGNSINYIVNRSDVYSILVYAIYDDYVESRFDTDFGSNLVKANNKIKIEAYTDLDDRNTFVLTKVGVEEPINFSYTYDNGCYTFSFDDEGTYKLIATDSYGNSVEKNFVISRSNINYNEGYITGYNNDGLLKGQGYTNKKLNIDIDSILNNGIQYVSTITSTEATVKGYKVVTKVERILYNTLTQDSVGLYSKYSWIITYEYTYYTSNNPTLTKKTKKLVNLVTGEVLEDTLENQILAKENTEFNTKFVEIIGSEGDNDYEINFRDSYGSIARKNIHYKEESTLVITRHTRSGVKDEVIDILDAINNGVWSNSSVIFTTTSNKFECSYVFNGETQKVTSLPLTLGFTADNGQGKFEYTFEYVDEYGNKYSIGVHLVRQDLTIELDENVVVELIDNVETTRNNIKLTFTNGATCKYRLDSGEEIEYDGTESLYKDGTYRFEVSDKSGNIVTKVIRKDTVCEFEFRVGTTNKALINGDVVNSGTVKFTALNGDSSKIKAAYLNNILVDDNGGNFSKDGLWTILIEDTIGNIQLFEFNIITHKRSHFEYTTPFTYKITEFWYDSGDGVLIDVLNLVNHTESNSSFEIKENGTYTVVMVSTILKDSVDFVFTIDTSIPNVKIVGCEEGERTNNDITFENISKGDVIEIYRNGELYKTVEITEKGDVPVINEGGKYTVRITNEAGVSTEVSFVRNNIANSAGSALIITILVVAVIGIIIGSVIHNRQKVDE